MITGGERETLFSAEKRFPIACGIAGISPVDRLLAESADLQSGNRQNFSESVARIVLFYVGSRN